MLRPVVQGPKSENDLGKYTGVSFTKESPNSFVIKLPPSCERDSGFPLKIRSDGWEILWLAWYS